MIKTTRAPYHKLPADAPAKPKYAAVANHPIQDPGAGGSLTLAKVSALDAFLGAQSKNGLPTNKTLYLKKNSQGTHWLSTTRSLWKSKQQRQNFVGYIYALGLDGLHTPHSPQVQQAARNLFDLAHLGAVHKLQHSAALCQCVKALKQALAEEAGEPSTDTAFTIDNDPRTTSDSDTSTVEPEPPRTPVPTRARTTVSPDERLDHELSKYFK